LGKIEFFSSLLDRMLTELEALSNEEAQRLLSQEMQQKEI